LNYPKGSPPAPNEVKITISRKNPEYQHKSEAPKKKIKDKNYGPQKTNPKRSREMVTKAAPYGYLQKEKQKARS
jgi:hypothetical protein